MRAVLPRILEQRNGPFGPSPTWLCESPWPAGTVLKMRTYELQPQPQPEPVAEGQEAPPAEPPIDGPVLCDHWEPVKQVISRSQANPNRPFLSCARPPWNKCDFFRWADVPHPYPQRPRPEPKAKGPEDASPLGRLCAITEEQRLEAWTNEQGTDVWHRARADRLTGTGFGPAAGHDHYNVGAKFLRKQLWGGSESSSDAMSWGKRHEDDGTDAYRLKCLPAGAAPVSTHGIWISRVFPFVGVSPDGAVPVEAGSDPIQAEALPCPYPSNWPQSAKRLVEVKCPYKFRLSGEGWEEEELPNGWRGAVPPYYFDQMQAQMLELGCTDCDFVVWTPVRLRVTRVPLDPKYCQEVLYPAALEWYFGTYMPAAMLRDAGRLLPGNVPAVTPTTADATRALAALVAPEATNGDGPDRTDPATKRQKKAGADDCDGPD